MKKILVTLTLFICGNLLAQSNLSPEEFMKYQVKVVNDENIAEVQKCYHFPHSVIENGQIIYNDKESIPVINYELFKKLAGLIQKLMT